MFDQAGDVTESLLLRHARAGIPGRAQFADQLVEFGQAASGLPLDGGYRGRGRLRVTGRCQPGCPGLDGDGAELVGYHVVQLPRQPGPFHILRVPGSGRGRIAVRTSDLAHAQRYGQ
jgi:hypothetical protein